MEEEERERKKKRRVQKKRGYRGCTLCHNTGCCVESRLGKDVVAVVM